MAKLPRVCIFSFKNFSRDFSFKRAWKHLLCWSIVSTVCNLCFLKQEGFVRRSTSFCHELCGEKRQINTQKHIYVLTTWKLYSFPSVPYLKEELENPIFSKEPLSYNSICAGRLLFVFDSENIFWGATWEYLQFWYITSQYHSIPLLTEGFYCDMY